MGMVLSFTPRAPAEGRLPKAAAAPAAVIIFPGVRYERQCAPGSGPEPSRPPREKPAPRH